ncbi:hypothetical protein, partial [Slackia equolifaciens]|uniref:hypothetical protein n=1 Tax=Slackia equolifaciens TaxID=498718 RepID=UPI00362BA790
MHFSPKNFDFLLFVYGNFADTPSNSSFRITHKGSVPIVGVKIPFGRRGPQARPSERDIAQDRLH